MPLPTTGPVVYPESDGAPLGENTLQVKWIIALMNGFEAYFRDHPEVQNTPEQRHLRNIVVSTRSEADQIASKARSGRIYSMVTEWPTMALKFFRMLL